MADSDSGDAFDTHTPATTVSPNSPTVIHDMLLLLGQQQEDQRGSIGSCIAQMSHSASAQMVRLAEATAQGKADTLRRAAVMELVGRLLSTAFPPAVSLHCFGSSANGLGTSDSDLDLHLGKIATIGILDRSSSVPNPDP
jgi:hypothetical protein